MKKSLISAALSFAALAYGLPAGADDRLARFDGGIGVIPVSRGTGTETVNPVNGDVTLSDVIRNDVRRVPPGGQPWVIEDLRAEIRTDGGIRVDG